ncbi:uncharacterized protein LOC142163514 [Nicotiana tabacum]|uniref:Uncharacterized protein LOC142163514 n=1 Tax=Nicotiana tabacum TaxID=4097 RepID=A0AC58RVZ0_TOBAC
MALIGHHKWNFIWVPSLTTMIKENQERDQVIAGFATNVNVLTKMFTKSQMKKVNVVEDVQPLSNEDFEEANYVNNSQGGYQRQQYQGQGQQNQWRPHPQGQGNQQWKNDQGSSNQVEFEPRVVEVGKVPEELKVQQENRGEVKEKVKETPKTLPPIPIPSPPFPQRLARKVSSIIATSTVQKKKDSGAFTIPCTIGAYDFARALCDNGASINLMPLSIYKQAGLGMPRPTNMRLQMADRSIKRPVGIVDDVLVKVGKFHLPAYFVILDCAVDKEIPIILGRPFLAIGRALMYSEQNEIKFRVNDEEVTFQASKGMKLPHEYESISVIDVVDEVEDVVEMKMEEQCLGEALAAILVNFDGEDMEGYMESVNALEGLGSYTYAPEKLSLDLENRATPPAKPSIIEPPQLELKPLPPHLRYKFLGLNDILPVIVSSLLNDVQVEQLLEVLKEHRQDIGWTIADIRGISPRICEHKIQLESETKPSVEHQRRLNPSMQEVVKKEIIKGFMDDFSVGDSFEHCLNNLRQVLKRCEETNLVLNWKKCHFMVDEGIVLGHKISKYGIEVNRAKIEIISKLPPPTSVKGVRSFFGHAGFYRHFIKYFSKIANPMCKLLEKDAKFVFDGKGLKAFEELKQSGVAIGAMLGQRHNKVLHLVYYASKTLNGAQMNYTVTEQQLLAIVYAFEKFRASLLGSKVKDRKGTQNQVADHLSRLEEAGRPKGDLEINDAFQDEHILALSSTFAPWYADIANYLVSELIPYGLESYQKKKFLIDCRQYYWEKPFLFCVFADNIIRRCVPEEGIMPMLKACHCSLVGCHHGFEIERRLRCLNGVTIGLHLS